MDKYCIIVAGEKFDVGARVKLWNDSDGLSFYHLPKSYGKRKLTLTQLQEKIHCFVLHHSVTYTAKSTYTGLIGRGLSVNFIIDDDLGEDGIATIYQCLDVCDVGYSHKPLNFNGPGVEISYQPTAWLKPDAYSEANIKKYNVQPHQIVDDKVHGVTRKVFAPTEAQVKACVAIAYGLSQAFPEMKMEFPKDTSGQIVKSIVKNPSGLLMHANITTEKMDPSGFPLEKMEQDIKDWKLLGL